MKNKKYLVLILVVISVVLVALGVTFASFTFSGVGQTENKIKTGTVTMVYTEGENKIAITNAMPIEDSEGKLLTNNDQVFDFTVDINTTQAIAYEVTAVKDDNATLENTDVRLYLERSLDGTKYEEVLAPSNYTPTKEDDKFGAKKGEMILDTGTVSENTSYKYRLRMWLSKDYEITSESKSFTVRVNVYGKEVKAGETHKGIVYLDPTDLSKYCDESNSVSTTETKTGCMKWYIFNDSGDNYTMILDHNTTARIKWNDSNRNVAYEQSNLKAVVDDLVTTSGWKVTPRLITADEVNTITGKTGFDASNTSSWYYFDTLTQTKLTYDSSNRSSYDWLYNNLNKCKTDSTDYGCTIEDNNTYSGYGTAGKGQTWAYWTSTPVGTAGSGSDVWYVARNGSLNDYGANVTSYGVRPVISVSKSIFDQRA